jgi:hypothetical protein
MRTETHRFDRVFDRAEGGHDDDLCERRGFPGALQHFEPADVSHPQIGDHEVVAVLRDHRACQLAVWGLVDSIALAVQHV